MSSPTLLCRPFTMSDDHHTSDNMIFDMDIGQSMPLQWDPHYPDQKAPFAFDTTPTSYEYGPTDSASYYDPSTVYNPASDLSKQSPSLDDNLYLSSWINESELSGLPSPSSPISIPSTPYLVCSASSLPTWTVASSGLLGLAIRCLVSPSVIHSLITVVHASSRSRLW